MEPVPRRLPKKRSASHIASENDISDTARQSHSHIDSFDPYDLSALDGGARLPTKATPQPLPRASPSLVASRSSKTRIQSQGRARTAGRIATELPSRTSAPALPKRSKTRDDIPRLTKREASEPKRSQGVGAKGGHASPSIGRGDDRGSTAGRRDAAGKRSDMTWRKIDDQRQGTTATPAVNTESAGPDSPLEPTRSAASPAPPSNVDPQPRTLERTPSAHKFTYGSKRSMLRESSSSLSLTTDPLAAFAPRLSPELPSLNPSSLSMDESEDEASNKGAIKSIHELRQAGANNRFADELDDLLERIDVPRSGMSSLRRVALLETATKLHERRFCRQFCDHGAQARLFTDLEREDDVINGFALVSALLTLFTASAGSSARYMQTVGTFQLFKKLLQQEDDICVIGKRRDANLSRRNQMTLSSLKATILRPGSWDTTPSTLSPRTLVLKVVITACQWMENTIPMKAFGHITDELFTILSARPRSDHCGEAEKLDCLMAASILGDLSAPAMESELAERWTKGYAQAVSAALGEVLEQPVQSFGPYENSILKLAMNSTNNSKPTAEWKGHGCLGKLARSSCACFQLVKEGVKEGGSWNAAIYDQLLLILGIMINFCEHLPPSSSPLDDVSLGSLVRTYLDNYALTHEADSVEESQLNVAVGYLAIVLGYLSLSPEVRRQLKSSGLLTRLDCLVNSIQEFIQVYKSVDSKAGSGSHVSRLQRLVELLSS